MKLNKEQKLKLYTNMVRVRKLDELMVKALLTGKIVAFFHSQEGQEAVGVGACTFLREDDYIFTGHRGHGIGKALPKGVFQGRSSLNTIAGPLVFAVVFRAFTSANRN